MIDLINNLLEEHGLARTAQRWILPANHYRDALDYGGYIIDVIPAEEYVPDCLNGFAVVVKDDGTIEVGAWDDGNYPSLALLTAPMVSFLSDLMETSVPPL